MDIETDSINENFKLIDAYQKEYRMYQQSDTIYKAYTSETKLSANFCFTLIIHLITEVLTYKLFTYKYYVKKIKI